MAHLLHSARKRIEKKETLPERRDKVVGSLRRELLAFLGELDERYFDACLDTGHCLLMEEEPETAICMLGKRLGCLHIHDTDGLSDRHTIPFDFHIGRICWDCVTAALRGIGYHRDFSLEVILLHANFPDVLKLDALQLFERVGRCLMEESIHKEENGLFI